MPLGSGRFTRIKVLTKNDPTAKTNIPRIKTKMLFHQFLVII
jgi:hypothetical protein